MFACLLGVRLANPERSLREWHQISTKTLFAYPDSVLLSLIIASTNLTILAPYSIDFTRASAAASELFTLIDRKSLIDPSAITGEQPPEGIIGEVELSNVTFSYPSRPETNILEGFSLRAPAGKVTALVVS